MSEQGPSAWSHKRIKLCLAIGIADAMVCFIVGGVVWDFLFLIITRKPNKVG